MPNRKYICGYAYIYFNTPTHTHMYLTSTGIPVHYECSEITVLLFGTLPDSPGT